MSVPSTPNARILQAESTPYKISSGDSLSNKIEDLNLRLAGELSGRMIENVPLDTFMETFLKSSYDEQLAPQYQDLLNNLVPPSDTSQATILPWLKSTFNEIGATCTLTSPIQERNEVNEDATQSEVLDWFISADKTMPNATDNARKLDFGMRTKGPDHLLHASNTPDFGTVEVVAEHTAQQNLDQQKWAQFAGYARFALHNQIDRCFIFGLLIHRYDCYLSIFLASCVIVALPFQVHDLATVMRVVTALHAVGPIGRGRDLRFKRLWTESSGDILQKSDETYIGYRLEFNPSNVVGFKLQVIGHLHRRFTLLGRRTHVALCRVTSIPRADMAPRICLKEGDHAVIKVSAIDTSSVATEAQLYAELVESGTWAVPLVAYSESGGGNKDTKDILGPLWEEIVKDKEFGPSRIRFHPTTLTENSIVNRQRRYLVFATVGIPLISLALEPADLFNAMVNVLKGLATYTVGEQKIRLLHRDLSPTNILVSVTKGEKIYLDNKMFVCAREKTRWAQANKNDSVFAGLFDLDLACKQGERTNLAGLTGHIAFLAPSVDLNWGNCRHYHQDVTSLFLCFAWMLCMPSPDIDTSGEVEVDKPPSALPRYALRSASSRSAGTGYIPHTRTQKTIKRTKPHPLYRWADPRLQEVKQNDCNNMVRVLRDSINELYKGPLEDKLYDLFETVFVGDFSWQPDRKLQRRLDMLGKKYDEAAHDEYLSLMNNRAPCLVSETIQMLLDLAKEATRNKSGVS